MNDTAYGTGALLPHTDCTYMSVPPGVQVFNCAAQSMPSFVGSSEGCTLLVDGFKVAEDLRRCYPDSFEFLVQTPVPFHCKQEGIDFRTLEPAIALNHDGSLQNVRINNDDRDVLSHLSFDDTSKFYVHWRRFNNMLRDPVPYLTRPE
jgi:hypothetical protein